MTGRVHCQRHIKLVKFAHSCLMLFLGSVVVLCSHSVQGASLYFVAALVVANAKKKKKKKKTTTFQILANTMVRRVTCRSVPIEGGGHQVQFPSLCCFGPLYSARQHWDGEGRDLAPGLEATSLWWWWN